MAVLLLFPFVSFSSRTERRESRQVATENGSMSGRNKNAMEGEKEGKVVRVTRQRMWSDSGEKQRKGRQTSGEASDKPLAGKQRRGGQTTAQKKKKKATLPLKAWDDKVSGRGFDRLSHHLEAQQKARHASKAPIDKDLPGPDLEYEAAFLSKPLDAN